MTDKTLPAPAPRRELLSYQTKDGRTRRQARLAELFCISAAVIARRRAGRWFPRHRLLGLLGAGSDLSGITVMVSGKIAHGCGTPADDSAAPNR